MIRALIFFICLPVLATDYYVSKSGNDGNAGTSIGAAWLTLDKAYKSTLAAGDVVHIVGTGSTTIWEEFLGAKSSGATNNPITYKFESGAQIRGITVTNVNFIRWLGQGLTNVLQIVNTNTAFQNDGIYAESCHYCQVIDMSMAGIYGEGVQARYTAPCAEWLVRGCYISRTGQRNDGHQEDGGPAVSIRGTNWVVEYNDISRTSDGVANYGSYNVIQNNFMHDTKDSYWAGASVTPHVDYFAEMSPDNSDIPPQHTLIQYNYGESNNIADSHGLLNKKTQNTTNWNTIYRCNIVNNYNSYGVVGETNYYFHHYNNTHATELVGGAQEATISIQGPAANSHTESFNNIFYLCNEAGVRIYYSGYAPSDFAPDYDLLESNTGVGFGISETHGVTANVLFNNYAIQDLTLQTASPARGMGIGQTTANGSGVASTALTVNNGLLLRGGYPNGHPYVKGDKIKVGSNLAQRIAAISGNSITLTTPITWSNNDQVYLDGTTDNGALPYQRANSLVGDYNLVSTTVTVNVTQGEARMVVVYVDGIPRAPLFDAPYTDTVSSGSITAVKLYPQYASRTLVYTASANSGGTTAPAGLRGKVGRR